MRILPLLIGLMAASPAAADEVFWPHWTDGKAELAGYALVQPRYGEARRGRAVLVFVTEPFSRSRGVKVDRFNEADPDQLTALKLNIVRKFQTGIYDYSLMTTVWSDPKADFAPLDVTFTGQEWCGHVHERARFSPEGVSVRLDSYFEGETGTQALEGPVVPEDALPVLLRQLDRPALDLTERTVRVLPSATTRRLQHKRASVASTTIRWSPPVERSVPAGRFDAATATYTRADGAECSYWIEAPYPHRIVGWRCTDGEQADLTGAQRLAYWGTHRNGDEAHLAPLGLKAPGYAP